MLLGVLASGYGKLSGAVIQLLLVPVLTLAWGLPLYGQWLLLSSIPVFLGASDFGFSTAAGIRIIGEVARGEHDEALLTYVSARALVLRLSIGAFLVALGVTLVLPERMLSVSRGMSAGQARVVLVLLCAYGMLALQSALFNAVSRSMGKTAPAILLDSMIFLVEGFAVMATAAAGGRPIHAALAYVVVRALGVMLAFGYARRVAPWMRAPARRSGARVRELWRPAVAAMVLPLAQAAYLQGSALAVGAAIGAPAVPIYTSLRTLSRIGLQLLAVLFLPLMPEYTATHARGDTRGTAIIAGGLMIANLVVGVAYALIIGFFGMPLLALWTHGMIQPPQAMITLTAIGLTMSVMWNPLSSLLLAINRHETISYVLAALAPMTIALTYVLMRRYGLTGSAAANLLMETGMLVTVVIALRRHGGRIAIGRDTVLAVLPPGWRRRFARRLSQPRI